MEGQQLQPITILGAGSWGTAIALYLARRGQTVRLWSSEINEIATLLAERTNNQFLPGHDFPSTIEPTANLEDAIKGVKDIIIAVPSVGYRDTITILKTLISDDARIVCATKGLDADTGQLLHDVTKEVLGDKHSYAVLSGPSFAREVADGLPTAVNIASTDEPFLQDLTNRFDSPIFQVYPSSDIVGTEIGGVAKNVIAIAVGISDGLGYKANTRSALITRGLAEIITLGKALGANVETFIGLSGIGDLILTCGDDQSRNRRLGLAIGAGKDVETAENEIGQVVEGKNSVQLIETLAEEHNVDMPICHTVNQILHGEITAKDGFDNLLKKSEESETATC